MIHVTDKELAIILDILEKYTPEGGEVWAFGSRQRGTHRKFSDLDLAVLGQAQKRLPFAVTGDMKEAFMDSLLPYRVDVLDYHAVSPEFQKIVAADHEVIFRQR